METHPREVPPANEASSKMCVGPNPRKGRMERDAASRPARGEEAISSSIAHSARAHPNPGNYLRSVLSISDPEENFNPSRVLCRYLLYISRSCLHTNNLNLVSFEMVRIGA